MRWRLLIVLAAFAWPAMAAGSQVRNLEVSVDATDVRHRIMTVHESFDVSEPNRPLILDYPQWIPGDHAPTGAFERIGDLVVRVDGEVVRWVRDPDNLFAVHIPTTRASKHVELQFVYLSADTESGEAVMTRSIVALKWPLVVFYPHGRRLTDITIRPHVQLPRGWVWASSLPGAHGEAASIDGKTVSLETLMDSPVYAGAHVRQIDLSAESGPRVRLSIFSDRSDEEGPRDGQIYALRKLVRETYELFGQSPFARYEMLVTLSDAFGESGLEHLSCGEIFLKPGHFADWEKSWDSRYLIAHEWVHAWNGKYRTPRGLVSTDLNSTLHTQMLWVYEGLTQYWAKVLTVRSGLWSADQGLQDFAVNVAQEAQRPSRLWRPLLDATYDPIINPQSESRWRSLLGLQDYYDAGALLWLDVDSQIRRQSAGRHSLDDLAKAFFALPATGEATLGHAFEQRDLVAALQRLAPYSWESVLHSWLDEVKPRDWQNMLAVGGYRLEYNDTPGRTCAAPDERRGLICFGTSIGATLTADGRVESVEWKGPAFRAGLGPGMRVLGVDGSAFSIEQLRQSIRGARSDSATLDLTVEDESYVEKMSVAYHGGLRYPHLIRVTYPAVFDSILAPHAAEH
ncbi:MAG: M61 family metallopeptidase [Proteobacteria bacterium]|nr:M61 family metallopeptidase [Pseudomonadota bacterium]